jgi:serine/threonine-protein kinase
MGTVVGRYALLGEIAAGGMASVHLGRFTGPGGFSRQVAIKRLHPTYAKDPEFVTMFLDEARLAARVQHPNVVSVIDVVATDDELFLVMEYVRGISLARVLKKLALEGSSVPPRIAIAIVHGALEGLHAAHEAKSEAGQPLDIVHRDVSPQNIILGTDGISRVLDFGIAKAAGRAQNTTEGQLKGKLAYMSREQLEGNASRQTDVFAAAVVLWETLTCKRLFAADTEAQTVFNLLTADMKPPSAFAPEVSAELDAIVMKGLEREITKRYATAREMATALTKCDRAEPSEVAQWLGNVSRDILDERAKHVASAEHTAATVTFAPTAFSTTAARPKKKRRWLVGLGLVVAGVASAFAIKLTRATNAPAAPIVATVVTSVVVVQPPPAEPSASTVTSAAPPKSAPSVATVKRPVATAPATATARASSAPVHGGLIETAPY